LAGKFKGYSSLTLSLNGPARIGRLKGVLGFSFYSTRMGCRGPLERVRFTEEFRENLVDWLIRHDRAQGLGKGKKSRDHSLQGKTVKIFTVMIRDRANGGSKTVFLGR